nr:anthranilate synthase component I [uncultured Butyrivibrio sp.]
MHYYPDLDTIRQYAESGDYDIAPVSLELLSDFTTPIEVMRKLKKVSTHCYMLESAQANEKWGRYSFLGYEPKLLITCSDGHMTIGDKTFDTKDPSAHIREVMACHRSPKIKELPTFTGGLVGYFSYDYLTYSEPTAKVDVNDTDEFKDVDLMLFDKVIAFDNVRQKIVLIGNVSLHSDAPSSSDTLSRNYEKATGELEAIKSLLINGEKEIEPKGKLLSDIKPLFNKEQYSDMVVRAKKHIFEGDIFQIVLSNYLTADYEGSLFNTYRRLRTINPSPYMFYFSGTDVELAGASPETLVKLEDGVLHTFPLAGTRKRGATEDEDKKLEKELLADEKELAEHNMLVDLGRNDLGKISTFGTVEVEKLHSIERFSHVMHIGSTVRGLIRPDKDALDAIEAVLPAGTLSGAPKIRACQLIGELENNKRGVYGGAVGYIDFSGNMDVCIAIRLLYKKNGKVFVRSGAGIVADSDPAKEYEECINKAKAALTALEASMEDET